jgi:hypothetical protein
MSFSVLKSAGRKSEKETYDDPLKKHSVTLRWANPVGLKVDISHATILES